MYYCSIVLLKSFSVPWSFCSIGLGSYSSLRILPVTFIAGQASETAWEDTPRDVSISRALLSVARAGPPIPLGARRPSIWWPPCPMQELVMMPSMHHKHHSQYYLTQY